MKPSHRFGEHVGEVQMIIVAPDLPGLFAEAGRALAEVLAGEAQPALDGAGQSVVVRAHDCEALLVAWLDELIFRSEMDGRVYTSFTIDSLSDHELCATIHGIEPLDIRTPVKAATMHGLRIEDGPDGVTATVVLDV
jgi:SHS2 domain-containing protein